ncbi:MAG: hypothetical protein CVU54_05975 [Deltaproteobacteria bacterium HGW-Deltaproteobacteria-12]|jgi:hypothetical protein|nr:MAG: hypothetical protein CVU54_05975 [Deltaproteobacteria bacterium HGW-Deltaproteobacteria-12]
MAIGFFTQGIEFTLPHPQIPQRTILLLCEVIKRAWQLLEEYPPDKFSLKSADEDTITQMLVEVIENRLRKNGEVDGFDRVRFGKVIREPKITNFNKKHPDKMPDIFFDLKRDQYPIFSEQDGLFVECKPIDSKHPISSCYCEKGIIRFVNGDYAWAMQDALMVGYIKSHSSFISLATVLNDDKTSTLLNIISHSENNKYAIYHSNHKREFEWLDSRGKAGPITVTHLWLSL